METQKKWEICKVNGYITAVDPGRLYTTGSCKEYKRGELRIGMNLCKYNSDLPTVILTAIAEDHIVISMEGKIARVELGKSVETPRHGLSYAYSDATIRLL